MATQTATDILAPAVAQLDGVYFPIRPFSVDEYHKLTEIGVIGQSEGVELLEGYLEMESCGGPPEHVISAMRGTRPVLLRKFAVVEFHMMLAAGMFDDERDRIELLEGMVIQMPIQNPPHSSAVRKATQVLPSIIPEGWIVQFQLPILVGGSDRAPDIAVVRAPIGRYLSRHPTRSDIALLGEISDSTIKKDRQTMATIFARDRIPIYWIINIPDAQIEVYSQPSIDDAGAAYYTARQDYGRKDVLPVEIKSRIVGKIRVRDLLP